ncbi:MAG TPA: thioredoxin domain-containing protein [Kofleriaceae bacterium]|jgi:protein-disulfide isomerase
MTARTLVRRIAWLGLASLVGCAQPQARVEHPVAGAAPSKPAADDGGGKIDRSGSVEQQLARLQDAYDHNAEAIDFLNKVYAQQKEAAARKEEGLAEDGMFAVDVSEDIKAGQVDGPADAPVTIIKAFDFACPYCQRMAPVMTELVAQYHGKIRVVYTNLLIHPPAKPAHLASCAAAKQGKYRQFKDAFWDKGFGPYAASGGKDASSLGEASVIAIAKGVGLDTAKLKVDMASPECAARLEHDLAELIKFHVDSTPMFFINGRPVAGAMPKADLEQIIDEQLKIAEASGVPGADYYQKVVLGKGEKAFRSSATPKH